MPCCRHDNVSRPYSSYSCGRHSHTRHDRVCLAKESGRASMSTRRRPAHHERSRSIHQPSMLSPSLLHQSRSRSRRPLKLKSRLHRQSRRSRLRGLLPSLHLPRLQPPRPSVRPQAGHSSRCSIDRHLSQPRRSTPTPYRHHCHLRLCRRVRVRLRRSRPALNSNSKPSASFVSQPVNTNLCARPRADPRSQVAHC
jgi:hypothetical protein